MQALQTHRPRRISPPPKDVLVGFFMGKIESEVEKSIPANTNTPSTVAMPLPLSVWATIVPPSYKPPQAIISHKCPGCQQHFEPGTEHPCPIFRGRLLRRNSIGGNWYFRDNAINVTPADVIAARAELATCDPSLLSWDFSWK